MNSFSSSWEVFDIMQSIKFATSVMPESRNAMPCFHASTIGRVLAVSGRPASDAATLSKIAVSFILGNPKKNILSKFRRDF